MSSNTILFNKVEDIIDEVFTVLRQGGKYRAGAAVIAILLTG